MLPMSALDERRTLPTSKADDVNADLGFGTVVTRELRQRFLNRDGTFNVRREGLGFWESLSAYHYLLSIGWPKFLGYVTISYVVLNAIFAIAYVACGPRALAGFLGATTEQRFFTAFFFSVHTLATIGYGNIVPLSMAANVIVTIESLAGLLGFGVVAGIAFARFARPIATIIFSDNAIIDLARRAEPHVQEIIVINQTRILRAPQILDALLENPRLSPEARRRALETREEFFEKKARLEEIKRILGEQETIDEAAPIDAISDLLEQAKDDATPSLRDAHEVTVEGLEGDKKQSMWAILLKMTISEKVQLAFKGDKTVRMILVRDRNRIVASAAIRNPRISESEVEAIAGMRNVEEEILRIIGHRRDWTSKYPIAVALAKNPKAPIGVVVPLINRLTLRDLKGLKDDKGVSEAVRANARKLYQAKQKS